MELFHEEDMMEEPPGKFDYFPDSDGRSSLSCLEVEQFPLGPVVPEDRMSRGAFGYTVGSEFQIHSLLPCDQSSGIESIEALADPHRCCRVQLLFQSWSSEQVVLERHKETAQTHEFLGSIVSVLQERVVLPASTQ